MERVKVEGFVAKLFVKEGNSSRGPWKATSAKILLADGKEDPRFYQFGFDAVPFQEGQFITFEADIKDEKTAAYVKGSGNIPKNPPSKPAAPAAKSGGKPPFVKTGGGGFKPREPVKSEVFGLIGQNSTEDDIRRITLSASRTAALAAVDLLLKNDALPTSEAKTKAGTAKRYEEIVAAIDKLTVKYFFDNATSRLLEQVADEGSTEKRVAALPDAEPTDEPKEPKAPVARPMKGANGKGKKVVVQEPGPSPDPDEPNDSLDGIGDVDSGDAGDEGAEGDRKF